MRVKHRGAELPSLGGKGGSEHQGARQDGAIIGAWMPEVPKIRKDANIFSDYNLCAMDSESLIVPLVSIATLSIGTIRLTATGLTSIPNLCSLDKCSLVTSPTSVYDLSQVAP